MTIEALIATYGYLAILLGVLVEGEIVVITAGFLAYRQLLHLDGVIGAALLGSLLTYHFFFMLGRTQGKRVLAKRPAWQARVSKVQHLLERYHTGIILGYRALFGLRMVTPFSLGMTEVPYRRFLALDVLPAVVWAVGFSCLGYFVGHQLDPILARIEEYQSWLVPTLGATLLTIALGVVAYRSWRSRA